MPEVVEYLEMLLDHARAGELKAFAAALMYEGRDPTNGWAGLHTSHSLNTILGETVRLQQTVALAEPVYRQEFIDSLNR